MKDWDVTVAKITVTYHSWRPTKPGGATDSGVNQDVAMEHPPKKYGALDHRKKPPVDFSSRPYELAGISPRDGASSPEVGVDHDFSVPGAMAPDSRYRLGVSSCSKS